MTERDKDQPERQSRNFDLDQSVATGRITMAEADVIRAFFAHKPRADWPASDLQRRMQSSGG